MYTPEAASPAMARMGVKQLMQRNCFPVGTIEVSQFSLV